MDTASGDGGETSPSSSTSADLKWHPETDPLRRGLYRPSLASQPLNDDVAEGRDVRELAVHICIGCFDGTIRFPLATLKGVWVDQGIDLFFHEMPVMRRHRCTGAKNPESVGIWHAEKLVLPMTLYDALLELHGVRPGPVVADRF